MLAIAERRSKPKAERFYRPGRSYFNAFSHHFVVGYYQMSLRD